MIACGAEATSRDKELEAEENEWSYVKNFKIHLHIATSLEKNSLLLEGFFNRLSRYAFLTRRFPLELPPKVGLQKIYSDFLRYILCHTRKYLCEATGSDPWLEQGDQAEVILTHPSAWGPNQQQFLQKAVIAAELIPADAVETRLHFLEEIEASMSFCVSMHTTLANDIPVS